MCSARTAAITCVESVRCLPPPAIIEPALQQWRDQGGPCADARVVFVCHSMGGLIARWYIERCSGAEITRKLITLGTPYRGAARSLGQLINGASPGLGPFRFDLTRFARSMPSLHQLLPEYACPQHGGDLAKTTEVPCQGWTPRWSPTRCGSTPICTTPRPNGRRA